MRMLDRLRSEKNLCEVRRWTRQSVPACPACLLFVFLLIFQTWTDNPALGDLFWSPDAKWICMRQEIDAEPAERLKPGWIFHPSAILDSNDPTAQPAPKNQIKSVIWIGRNDRKIWHKVAETSPQILFLSQPAWSPDGRSLFYAAARRLENGSLHWQVLQISSLQEVQRAFVVWEQALPPDWQPPMPGTKQRKTMSILQSGPDNLLVFADPAADSLLLYRSDSHEIIARLSDGYQAKISNTGEHVAWLRSDIWPAKEAELMLTRTDDASHSTHFRRVLPDSSLTFSKNAPEILISRHLPPPSGMKVPPGSDWPEICKVSLNSSRSQRFAALVLTPILPNEHQTGASFTVNPEEDTLVFSTSISTRPVEIVWFLPKSGTTHKRFPPLDMRTDARSLTLSADQQLALRFGTPTHSFENDRLPAGFCELGDAPQIQPLSPDEDAAQAWTLLLARCIAKTLNQDVASTGLSFTSPRQDHFFLAPNLAEFPGINPASNRLARFSRIGLEAIGLDPLRPNPVEIDRLNGWRLEAAALFLILTNHHDLALKALDRIDFRPFDPTTRGRLFALKAQEYIESGRQIEAQAMIESIILTEPKVVDEVQQDGQEDRRLTPVTESSWMKFLLQLKQAGVEPPREAEGRSPTNPLGHFNPDDPENDPDLQLQMPRPIN